MAAFSPIVRSFSRWLTVAVAVSFLGFYVWQAQRSRREKAEMFSSSKNLRQVAVPGDGQFFLTPALEARTPSDVPVSAEGEGVRTEPSPSPFLLGIAPSRPVLWSSTKSGLVVEAPDRFLWWGVVPEASLHTFGLPPLRVSTPPEVTVGPPWIQAQVVDEKVPAPGATPAKP